MSIIDSLICDRTESDVDALEVLLARAMDTELTDEEQAILGASAHKGAYNYTDLNRVGQAAEYLSGILNSYGYPVTVVPKTDWAEGDIPTPAQLAAYLADLAKLRAVLAVLPTTPAVPADMEELTVEEANAIEKILVDLDAQLRTMATTFVPCGDALCGGEYL